jgi:thiosulfate/3-mercaptopyruvate sulfurtransferase
VAFQTLIDVGSLRSLLGKPGLIVVDCRFDLQDPDAGRNAFLQGHIPGAVYADINRDLSAPIDAHTGRHPLPEAEVFATFVGRLGVTPETQLVAYDGGNGSFAARFWWMSRWIGHFAVAVLDGGYKAWMSGDDSHNAERLSLGTAGRSVAVVTAAEVIEALQSPATTLVDARAPERFAGTVEPIDTVAGHIPGAINHPFTQNLDPSGRFLPPDELRRRWQATLAGRSPDRLIAMCGSGVTACHNLLSLEIAGLVGASLYAGSWSEWIRDPRRPVKNDADDPQFAIVPPK